ncbi:hypothetical protein B9Z19DRAFT_1125055 [Tuber borchii]|uniref:Uncharacterized protein n=1 Tax=Tuber borchii TaxID=42251 RepID=A0A2T6ZVM5_TUBBO|nr:hypothetical protein B9Z19DRAFT_1125055 [Tuber borchii]
MPPPPPPFYPEADEQDGEVRINAIATAITRLARILGLGKDQTEADPVGERNPGIPIGGANGQSYVFLDKPREPSPIHTTTTATTVNMRRASQRRPRSIVEFLPDGLGNSGGHVGNVLRNALPFAPSAALHFSDDYPAAGAKNSVGVVELLLVGLTFIIMCMCVHVICHLCLPRHGGGSRNVSGGMYPDVPVAGGNMGGFYGIGAPESQAANLAPNGEARVGAAPPRYDVANGGWEMGDLGRERREGSMDLGERGASK